MKIQTIYEDGNILRQEAEHIIEFDKELYEFANQMWKTIRWSKGVGIAAPQLGIGKRMIAIDTKAKLGRRRGISIVMTNPSIESSSQGKILDYERCLSVPDAEVLVPRYDEIVVSYFGLTGIPCTKKLHGFNARVVQHEIDHLNGKLIVDYEKDHQKAGAFNGYKNYRYDI